VITYSRIDIVRTGSAVRSKESDQLTRRETGVLESGEDGRDRVSRLRNQSVGTWRGSLWLGATD
jgi:hypothetical protein